MITPGMMSSLSNEWTTPDKLFKELDDEFHFTLDPCSTHENTKCKDHYTMEDRGLEKDWQGSVFMNPPYGREIGKWIKKAYDESKKGATVVCLIPSRTDTAYWHDYVMKGDIRFIRGRLKFSDGNNPAPFPSAIVIFKQEVS